MNSHTLAKLTLGTTMIFSVAAFSWHTALAQPQVITCGATLNGGHFRLAGNVVCADGDTSNSPAITLTEGTVLDLNGYIIDCNKRTGDGILITGTGNALLHGTVSGCREGVRVPGDHNQIVGVIAHANTRAGFFVNDGDNNHFINCVAEENRRQGFYVERPELADAGADDTHFVNCLAKGNGQHGFKILQGDGTHIRHSEAIDNCRDGIEIEAGDDNSVINNRVEDNGNKAACGTAAYRPWFYAGIDILADSYHNEVINNKTSGNTGCMAQSADGPCEEALRERNLWDENVDDVTGECISTNRWHNNREDGHKIAPECAPGPL
jgi:hypothetical protein